MIARWEKKDKGGVGLAFWIRDNIMFQEILMDGPFKQTTMERVTI